MADYFRKVRCLVARFNRKLGSIDGDIFAAHEAGHAIVAASYPSCRGISHAKLTGKLGFAGEVRVNMGAGFDGWQDLVFSLAGAAGEYLQTGKVVWENCSSDLDLALRQIYRGAVAPTNSQQAAYQLTPDLKIQIERCGLKKPEQIVFGQALLEAIVRINSQRAIWEKLRDLLIEKQELNQAELLPIYRQVRSYS